MAEETQEYLDLEGLEEYHSKVNDLTTEINLARGTRDFVLGSNEYVNNLKTDGWNKPSAATIIYKVDDEGFTNVKIDGRYDLYSSTVFLDENKKNVTASFEFKIDAADLTEFQNGNQYIAFATFRNKAGSVVTPNTNINKALGNIGETNFKADTWYKVVVQLECDNEEADFFTLSLRGDTDVSVWYRKVAVNSGLINNPIWSPSPFDIDHINDETTAINLFRGTKDFTKGTTLNNKGNTTIFIDGFRNTDGHIESNSGEFSVFTNDSANNTILYSNAIEELNDGDVFTIAFDVMFDEAYKESSSTLFNFYHYVENSGVESLAVSNNTVSNNFKNFETGKWFTYVVSKKLEKPVQENSFCFVQFNRPGQGLYKIRKLCCYKGYINNPIWSASPFDIDRINNETTGINLLRGTRDFFKGTIPAGVRETNLKSDGMTHTVNQWEIVKPDDPNEFSYARRLITGSASHLYFNPILSSEINSNEFTVSFEFMFEESPTATTNLIQFLVLNNGNTDIAQQVVVNTSNVGFSSFRDIPVNTWIKASYIINDVNVQQDQYIRLGLVGSSTDSVVKCVRKVKLEIGSIYKPIWSPSPFDIDVFNDETTEVNLVCGTRDFKLGKELSMSSAYYIDGWKTNDVAIITEDDDGFSIATITRREDEGNKYFCSPMIYGLKSGDTITISFDVMVEDISESLIGNTTVLRYDLFSPAGVIGSGATFKLEAGIKGRIETGKWYRWSTTTTIIDGLVENGGFLLTPRIQNKGTINFKKFTINRGSVNNPLWSISPKDIKRLNDINTGINLIRGSRDFTIGTIKWNTQLYTNGFTQPSNYWKKTTDDSGFSVWKYLGTSSSLTIVMSNAITSLRNKGDIATFYFEFMLEDARDTSYGDLIQIYVINQSTNVGSNLQDIKYAQVGLNADELESEKWYKCSFCYTLPKNLSDDECLRVSVKGANTRVISYRKLAMYKGYIENPIWSDSPFDRANSQIEDGAPYLMGVLSSQNSITSNTDLNELKEFGTYYSNSAVTQTLKNTPAITGAYRIKVESGTNAVDDYIRQRMRFGGTESVEYIRDYHETWGKWKETVNDKSMTELPYNPGIYEGRSIPTKFAAEIGSNNVAYWLSSRAIQGNFEGLNIGDYVDIACTGTTRRYVIAAIDPFYRTAYGQPTAGHSIVMVPEKCWKLSTSLDGEYAVNTSYIHWSTTGDNNGTAEESSPYMGSNLHKWETEVAIKQFPQEWQDVMVDRNIMLETKYSASSTLDGPNGRKWCNLGKLWSLSEVEIFGTSVYSDLKYNRSIECQFPIFYKPSYRNLYEYEGIWLRNTVVNSTRNACVSSFQGQPTESQVSSTSIHAYPCFLIG